MQNKKVKHSSASHIAILLLPILFAVAGWFYYTSNYVVFESPVNTVELHIGATKNNTLNPVLYGYQPNAIAIDYSKPYRFVAKNDTVLSVTNLASENISKFRIYFEAIGTTKDFKKIVIANSQKQKTILLSHINSFDAVKIKDDNTLHIWELNGYIDLPHTVVNAIPYTSIVIAFMIWISIVVFLFSSTKLLQQFLTEDKRDYVFIFFICSLFLFAPLYNIALILGLAFYIWKFNWTRFKSNKLNILFCLLFLVYLANAIVTKEYEIRDFRIIERLLPMVLIPLLLASVTFYNTFKYLIFTAVSIGLILIGASTLDYLMLGTFDYFSFDEFSKIYHPVYLSYLFMVCIFYLEENTSFKLRRLLQAFCLLLLLFLGSKLVLVIGLLLYLLFYVKHKRKGLIFLSALGVFILLIVFVKPLNKRFSEVFNSQDISILYEEKIEDKNDARVNGFTLRLLLWKETFATMKGWKEHLFGNGVTKSKEKELNNRVEALGLTNHIGFNPHNQFIDTYWRTGLVGLTVLLALFFIAIKKGITSNNRLLLVITLLLFFAMFSESLFGRVRGIYFFTTILLVAATANKQYENRNTRN